MEDNKRYNFDGERYKVAKAPPRISDAKTTGPHIGTIWPMSVM